MESALRTVSLRVGAVVVAAAGSTNLVPASMCRFRMSTRRHMNKSVIKFEKSTPTWNGFSIQIWYVLLLLSLCVCACTRAYTQL